MIGESEEHAIARVTAKLEAVHNRVRPDITPERKAWLQSQALASGGGTPMTAARIAWLRSCALAGRVKPMTNAPTQLEILQARIAAALDEMDHSMYGDPEVPFRMRAKLEGK